MTPPQAATATATAVVEAPTATASMAEPVGAIGKSKDAPRSKEGRQLTLSQLFAPAPPMASVSTLLSTLPCRWDAFTEGTSTPGKARRYVPGASDAGGAELVVESPTRSLVRALGASQLSPVRPIVTRAAAAASAASTKKRPREDATTPLEALPKRDKQRCLRMALVAATSVPSAHPQLADMRQKWLQDPRHRFRLTKDLLRALALTVVHWPLETLHRYADAADLDVPGPAAGVGNGVTRPRPALIAAVRTHLLPAAPARTDDHAA